MSPASSGMRLLALECSAIYDYVLRLREQKIAVPGNPDYGALLKSICNRTGVTTFDQRVAFVAVNPTHEGQQKFTSYLSDHLHFVVDGADYRDAFVVPGRECPYQRLSTRLTYLLGLLAHKKPRVIVVSDAFEVYYPLLDLVTNRGGSATIAFFRGAMEDRWQRVGIFDTDSPVSFVDLSEDARLILGVDLGSSLTRPFGKSGIGSIQFD
jgi:hypothetical protein